jgi:hypothetical protein
MKSCKEHPFYFLGGKRGEAWKEFEKKIPVS